MKTIDINPANAEGYLYRAERTVRDMADGERVARRFHAESLLNGLFSLCDDDIPLTEAEKIDLAAFELACAGDDVSTHLLTRIKRAVLNVALARVFSGVAACWNSPDKTLDTRRPGPVARSVC